MQYKKNFGLLLSLEAIMFTYTAPFGKISLTVKDQRISKILFIPKDTPDQAPPSHIIDELDHYFKNPRHMFNVDLFIEGTSFQKAVWQALQAIPSGTTVTYKDVAERLNTSPRAVGNACRANHVPIVIPCHRVVAKHGLGGFAGDTSGKLLDIKKWLLHHEAL